MWVVPRIYKKFVPVERQGRFLPPNGRELMIKIWGQIKDSKLPDIETERLYLRQRLVSDADDILLMRACQK